MVVGQAYPKSPNPTMGWRTGRLGWHRAHIEVLDRLLRLGQGFKRSKWGLLYVCVFALRARWKDTCAAMPANNRNPGKPFNERACWHRIATILRSPALNLCTPSSPSISKTTHASLSPVPYEPNSSPFLSRI